MLASRLHWRLLIGTILILMAAAWLAPRWVRPPDIQENRILAPEPERPTRLQDLKTYRLAADAYVADHFVARPHLIGALNRLRMMAGVSGSKRVIVGRDGWLFFDDDTHLGASRGDPPMAAPELRNWLMYMAGRTEALQARRVPYLVVAAPVKEIIYPQFGPSWYPGPSESRATIQLPKLAKAAGVGEVLYLGPAVADATRRGFKTYSRHDTHWTGYGAYAGYASLMTRLHAMGVTDGPRPMSDFVLEGGDQKGRPRDLALMLGVSSFVPIDFPHIDNPAGQAKIKVTYLGDRQDWTAPQVIETGEVGKPTLLMTRDSFSNELLPMMLSHFSRIVVAHNQDGAWRPDLIERFKPDIVLLEVVEHGLRVSMGDGPPASAAALARIDRLLSNTVAPAAPGPAAGAGPVGLIPTLRDPDRETTAIIQNATVTGNCNVESASLAPGTGGEATFNLSGWMAENGSQVTSPSGYVALISKNASVISPIKMDLARPDVGTFLKNPTATQSGFTGSFYIKKLPPGVYTPTVFRRAGSGWLACTRGKTFTMP